MKIRSDFVTNSSSSSFVAIKINSKAMAELLAKYKEELGDFLSPDTIEFFGELEITEDTVVIEGGIPESSFGERVPGSLSEFISKFASLLTFQEVEAREHIGDGEYNEEFDDLLTELFDRETELLDSMERVEWKYAEDGHGENGESEYGKVFKYDKNNGESYTD